MNFTEQTLAIAKYIWSLPYKDRQGSDAWRSIRDQLSKNGDSIPGIPQLQRIARQVDEAGYVKHRFGNPSSLSFPDRLPDQEDRLAELFQLRFALVADISNWFLQPGKSVPADPLEYDDTLHELLGKMGTRVLGPILRPADRLGVASGRGPGGAADNLTEEKRAYPELAEVVALCGNMKVRQHSTRRQLHLDANSVVNTLEDALPGTPFQVRVDKSLTTSVDPDMRLGFSFATHQPNVALVGIGAVGGKHRLMNYKEIAPLEAIHSELGVLLSFAKEYEAHFHENDAVANYHCIGDVCNYLFAVPPPGGSLDDLPDEFREQIEWLNQRIASTRLQDLGVIATTGSVLAIAGGVRHKAFAMRHALLMNKPKSDGFDEQVGQFLTHIVTCDRMAEWLDKSLDIARHPNIDKAKSVPLKRRKQARKGK